MKDELIAHVLRDDDSWKEPQGLLEHLENTALIAQINAKKFDSGDWGRLVGLAHDAGKGREAWQKYVRQKSGYDEEAHLEGKHGKLPHAIQGAKLVEELFGKGIGRILAYSIAGHHAGLPDWSSAAGSGQASLQFQRTQANGWQEINKSIVDAIQSAISPVPPWKFSYGMDLSLWIRMLFSCLVDADFLDTEKYMDQDQTYMRGTYRSISELLNRYNQYIADLEVKADETEVNKIRRNIRTKCIQMAGEKQGIFSLSVPTGGGKTLSTLAFGLEHAKKHKLDRIIYVIPYTSIIEQNADVFRAAVGEDQVVEHHSSIDIEDLNSKSRLAAENWDAPIIVTTTVQFFESLFAAKTSRCRKLHNISRSVVILDEAQLLPVEYLEPILHTMQLLTDHYHVSFVISTATQPAFESRITNGEQFKGLKNIREIMGGENEVIKLYQSLKRNEVYFPEDIKITSNWEQIAEELSSLKQVLCIVSDRKSCRELHSLMPKGTYHLSALMCGQHRSEIIKTIKEKLNQDETVRVISTQLVEAGVDFDFPVIYRAMAGLDSIAQAAGRCNREGKMPNMGKVKVFIPPRKAPPGILRKASDTAVSIILSESDPLAYHTFEKYFADLYWKANSLDSKNILQLLDPNKNDPQECSILFRTAADRFRIIDDSQIKTIFVRYDEGDKLIDQLKWKGPDRWLLRKLQRYAVNGYESIFYQMLKRGSVEEVQPNIFATTSSSEYSNEIGLLIDTSFEPENYIF